MTWGQPSPRPSLASLQGAVPETKHLWKQTESSYTEQTLKTQAPAATARPSSCPPGGQHCEWSGQRWPRHAGKDGGLFLGHTVPSHACTGQHTALAPRGAPQPAPLCLPPLSPPSLCCPLCSGTGPPQSLASLAPPTPASTQVGGDLGVSGSLSCSACCLMSKQLFLFYKAF